VFSTRLQGLYLEDRIQFECAQIINAHYIITRNIADFPNSSIPVILPEDFLKIIEEQQKQGTQGQTSLQG
jgi:hypothetical protein